MRVADRRPRPNTPTMAPQAESIDRWRLAAGPALEELAPAVDAFIAEFYGSLDRRPRHAAVLRSLPPERIHHLQTAQRRHLLELLKPDLDEEEWQKAARRIGREHVRYMVPSDWISESYRMYARHLVAHVETLALSAEERWQLCSRLIGRLFHDLSMQTSAYAEGVESTRRLRDLPAQLDRLLLAVPSMAALYPRLSEFLLQVVHVDGLWLGTPDPEGVLRYHFVAGEGIHNYLADGEIELGDNPNCPLANAWATGVPQFVPDWTEAGELAFSPFWWERGLKTGWRSSCAIPVTGTSGQRDVLVLYSKEVNFFGQNEMRQLVMHLHGLLGMALERLRLLEELEQKHRTLLLYKAAMDASAKGVLITDASPDKLSICYVNPAFERMTGYRADEVIGKSWRTLRGPQENPDEPEHDVFHKALETGQPRAVEIQSVRKDGSTFWNAMTIAPVHDAAGRITHLISTQTDITTLKTAVAESDRANSLYRALMGAAELVIRAQGERVLLDELCRMLVQSGLFAHVWIGKPNPAGDMEVLSLFSTVATEQYWYRPNIYTDDPKRFLIVRAWRESSLQYTNDRNLENDHPEVMRFYRDNKLRANAVLPLYRDGELWALLVVVSHQAHIFNEELLGLLEGIGRLLGHGLDALDVRQILEEERQHQAWLARHDALTDILNRRGLMERLEEAVARARRHQRMMAVAIMDLDGFKMINDVYGHPAGDLMLRSVADRLQSTLRQTDAVGRMGGDEFVLIVEDLDQPDDLAMMLSRVQTAVEGPVYTPSGRAMTVQCSIGVTVFPEDDSSPERLLRHADRALYSLKERRDEVSKRWMLFHAEADEEKHVRQQTILKLFRAGHLRVHYQPVLDLQTGKVFGVEALARLAGAGDRLLMPADFLPQLSPTDLVTLTHQVLSQSILDLHVADEAGFELNVGINFEPTTLADPKAMHDLRRQIETSGIRTNRIVLELLERMDTLSMAGSQQALRDLKTCGARVALDDVGSAYSSLLRVKELPIDIIKLDRSFLRDLERQPKELRFIMNLVQLARTLGLELVAEGIESTTSSDALAALGVRLAQGYCIARPMPMEDLLVWLKAHRPVAWVRPTSVLGSVALQLRDLDATGRILEQRPSFLKHLLTQESGFAFDVDEEMLQTANGTQTANLAAAHKRWRKTMSSLASRPSGGLDHAAFQEARMKYEEAMFDAALESRPPENSH